MGFVESIKTCYSKYFVFSGRSTRSELWYFVLFLVTGGLSVGIIDVLFYPDISLDETTLLDNIFIFGTIIPSISVCVRRLHDVNRSGWWYFIPLTIIGIIPYLYWMVKPSDTSNNKYGPKPAK